jgi:hypothetical protein
LLSQPPLIQPQLTEGEPLTIDQPNDRYEREADRVADLVMRMPDPRLQRQVEPEEEEEEQTLQTKPLAARVTPLVQRQEEEPEEEEEELLQPEPLAGRTLLIQRQVEPEEEEEEPVQARLSESVIQRQEEEPEEEEEEPVQTKLVEGARLQRQAELEEDEEGEEPIQTKLTEGAHIQRQEEETEDEEEEPVQTKRGGGQFQQSRPGLATRIESLRSGGQPLPKSGRDFFETRFGCDFSRVRIHTGDQAAEAARMARARAFTVGRDVVFGAGQYAPQTRQGQRLLAHELVHTIQQGRNHVVPSVQRVVRFTRFPARDLEEQDLDRFVQSHTRKPQGFHRQRRRILREKKLWLLPILKRFYQKYMWSPGETELVRRFVRNMIVSQTIYRFRGETHLAGRIRQAIDPLSGYTFSRAGSTRSIARRAARAGAEEIPVQAGRYRASFAGADILFFGGHFYLRGRRLAAKPRIYFRKWIRHGPLPRVKLIIASSCNIVAAKDTWRRIFPNAYVIGYWGLAPYIQRGFVSRFIDTLPRNLSLQSSSGLEAVVSAWKAYIEQNRTRRICRSKSGEPQICVHKAGYMRRNGDVYYYTYDRQGKRWIWEKW